jgi:hypothetical protein
VKNGSDLAQFEWAQKFGERLREAGFTDDQVDVILEVAPQD